MIKLERQILRLSKIHLIYTLQDAKQEKNRLNTRYNIPYFTTQSFTVVVKLIYAYFLLV